jgi:hypothetical protein
VRHWRRQIKGRRRFESGQCGGAFLNHARARGHARLQRGERRFEFFDLRPHLHIVAQCGVLAFQFSIG